MFKCVALLQTTAYYINSLALCACIGERANIVTLSFYNSLTSYELSFFGISNFTSRIFFPVIFFRLVVRSLVFSMSVCVGVEATKFSAVRRACGRTGARGARLFEKSSTYAVR